MGFGTQFNTREVPRARHRPTSARLLPNVAQAFTMSLVGAASRSATTGSAAGRPAQIYLRHHQYRARLRAVNFGSRPAPGLPAPRPRHALFATTADARSSTAWFASPRPLAPLGLPRRLYRCARCARASAAAASQHCQRQQLCFLTWFCAARWPPTSRRTCGPPATCVWSSASVWAALCALRAPAQSANSSTIER